MKQTKHARDAGFTLVGILVAIGIFSIVAAATATYLVHLNNARYRMEAIGTRDALNLRLRRLANLATIQFSSAGGSLGDPGNAQLAQCVVGGNCVATSQSSPVAFVMSYPNGAGQPQLLAGTQINPVLYCHNGGLYNAASRNCRAEWQASSYFTAQCPEGAGSCSLATFVRVNYVLTNLYLGGQPLLTNLNGQSLGTGANGMAFTTIAIPQPTRGLHTTNRCSALSFIFSIDQFGQQTCRCIPGAVQTGGTAAQPACGWAANQCPNGQVATGQSSTMAFACRPPFTCTKMSFSSVCNGFIQSLNLGGCVITYGGGKGKGKKSGGNNYNCGNNSYECCTSG